MIFKKFFRKLWKRKFLIGSLIAILVLLLLIFVNFYIPKTSTPYIFDDIEDVPSTQAALILGSKVYSDGSMSDILADRIIKALELYDNGQVSKILISGDHGTTEYDEVNTVKDYLLENDFEDEDVFLDHAGFDTYDSLYRAKHIFEVESVVIVTQEFHLPRAVYIGNSLGIETYGYIADRQPYIAARWNSIRESLARLKAFLNVVFHSKSKYLGEQIPITGDGRLSWD